MDLKKRVCNKSKTNSEGYLVRVQKINLNGTRFSNVSTLTKTEKLDLKSS